MNVLRVIGMLLIVLVLTACRKYDDEPQEEKQPAVFNIYVYAPEHPLVTRSDIGDVTPIDNSIGESMVKTLQIWVFNHDSHELIAYYSPESVEKLNNGNGETYQLSASDAFTQADPKPAVDIYVLANAESCGKSFDKDTESSTLENALIEGDDFGLNTLIGEVPTDGLPMSGVKRGATVSPTPPVFDLPTVTLTRAVSKIRFIFSREKPETEADNVPVKINSIKLDAEMIPTQEYLFLETGENATAFHVGSYGTAETNPAKEFLNSPLTDIAQNKDPMAYSYQANQTAQEYEDLITEGLNKTIIEDGVETLVPELTQVGPFYLRESGKLLSGTITFQKDDGTSEAKDVRFEMHDAGDFSRNHTWIVYAYYSVSGLVAVTVVVKDWTDVNSSHVVYNW